MEFFVPFDFLSIQAPAAATSVIEQAATLGTEPKMIKVRAKAQVTTYNRAVPEDHRTRSIAI